MELIKPSKRPETSTLGTGRNGLCLQDIKERQFSVSKVGIISPSGVPVAPKSFYCTEVFYTTYKCCVLREITVPVSLDLSLAAQSVWRGSSCKGDLCVAIMIDITSVVCVSATDLKLLSSSMSPSVYWISFVYCLKP